MKKSRLLLSIIAPLLMETGASAVILKWDIPENDRLEIVKTARINYLINQKIRKAYEERNIIDLTCHKKEKGRNHVKGVFTIFEKEQGSNIFLQKEKYGSDFIIEENGFFTVPEGTYMPNLRHIPTFPPEDIKEGERWSMPAMMIITKFSVPFSITFHVMYTLSKVGKIAGDDVATIDYEYQLSEVLSGQKLPSDFPVKIMAANKGVIYWDLHNNRPIDIKDKYRIIFLHYDSAGSGYASEEFQMQILTDNKIYPSISDADKNIVRDEFKKNLEKEGVDVDTEKRGLVLRMGDVLFDFDSYMLRPDAKSKLDSINDVIRKKYPDREIIVEGHTDSTGEKGYNQKLSEERAKSVAEYLKGGSGHDKFSYKGFGDDNPNESNSTPEGRKKNRRVEIIIKLN